MRLLKIIAVFFIFYFVRRFIQLYKSMKKIQEAQARNDQGQANSHRNSDNVINADFKVVD